jgi:hypothetical protein
MGWCWGRVFSSQAAQAAHAGGGLAFALRAGPGSPFWSGSRDAGTGCIRYIQGKKCPRDVYFLGAGERQYTHAGAGDGYRAVDGRPPLV